MTNRKIFIALEDYELPNHVAEYGVQLAKTLGIPAELVAVEQLRLDLAPSAFTQMETIPYDTFDMGNVIEAVRPQVQALTETMQRTWPQTSYSLEPGFRETTLVEKSENEHPSLVVVERRSNLTTLNEWFGTHETRLAEHIPVPVLIVPENVAWQPVRKILYVMDLNDDASQDLRTLQQLSSQFGATLTVAVVSSGETMENNPAFMAATAMLRQLPQHAAANFVQIFTDEAATAVENLARETVADWLAFEEKDQSFISRIFDHYNNKHLILQSEIPVLVL